MNNSNDNTHGTPVRYCNLCDHFNRTCWPRPFYCCWPVPCPPCPPPKPETFAAVYHPNGGVGGSADLDLIAGSSYTIKAPETATVSRPGYTFVSWNTRPDGAGTVYLPGDAATVTQNLFLYAQWEMEPPGTANVVYDPNGGTGGLSDTVTIGTGYLIRTSTETNTTRPGYAFTGWNTRPDGGGTVYTPGDMITVSSDLILYAQWQQITYTLTYHKNDPVVPDGQTMTFGPYAPETAVTVISISQTSFYVPGYVFIGWNTQWDGAGTSYVPNTQMVIDADRDLYAMWMRRD